MKEYFLFFLLIPFLQLLRGEWIQPPGFPLRGIWFLRLIMNRRSRRIMELIGLMAWSGGTGLGI